MVRILDPGHVVAATHYPVDKRRRSHLTATMKHVDTPDRLERSTRISETHYRTALAYESCYSEKRPHHQVNEGNFYLAAFWRWEINLSQRLKQFEFGILTSKRHLRAMSKAVIGFGFAPAHLEEGRQ